VIGDRHGTLVSAREMPLLDYDWLNNLLPCKWAILRDCTLVMGYIYDPKAKKHFDHFEAIWVVGYERSPLPTKQTAVGVR